MSSVHLPITPKGRATVERLLDAARQVALSTGGTIEIADVAAKAGVVPSLVNRYFGSKSGLIVALVDDYFDRFHQEVMETDFQKYGTWAQSERRRLEAGVRFHYRDPLSVIIHGQLTRDAEVARREAERVADVVDRAARSIRKAQKAGELPAGTDPGMAGAAMFGAMRLVLVEAMSRKPRPSADRIIDFLWRHVAALVHIDPELD